MWTSNSCRGIVTALLAIAALATSPDSFAQGAQKDESDPQFLSRMQSRLDRAQRRIEDMEKLTRQKMGSTTATSGRLGIEGSGTYNQPSRNPMSSDLQRMRLEFRSLGKKIDKDRERMSEQYRTRGDEEFDRDYWEAYVRRLERDLDEMQRDLYRL